MSIASLFKSVNQDQGELDEPVVVTQPGSADHSDPEELTLAGAVVDPAPEDTELGSGLTATPEEEPEEEVNDSPQAALVSDELAAESAARQKAIEDEHEVEVLDLVASTTTVIE